MKNQKNKRTFAFAILFWILTAMCAAVIFFLSSQTAEESSAMSEPVQGFLGVLFGKLFDHELVREFAHYFEFCGLGFLLYHALRLSCNKPRPFLTVLITALYSISDEVHQIFVPGRACELFDFEVDTLGGATAVFVLLLCGLIGEKIKKCRNTRKQK